MFCMTALLSHPDLLTQYHPHHYITQLVSGRLDPRRKSRQLQNRLTNSRPVCFIPSTMYDTLNTNYWLAAIAGTSKIMNIIEINYKSAFMVIKYSRILKPMSGWIKRCSEFIYSPWWTTPLKPWIIGSTAGLSFIPTWVKEDKMMRVMTLQTRKKLRQTVWMTDGYFVSGAHDVALCADVINAIGLQALAHITSITSHTAWKALS